MDDILVLILTLIFIIAGIYGQMKKKELQSESTPPPRPADDDFWHTMEQAGDEEEPMGVSEHLQPVIEVAKEDRFHTPGSQMKREFTREPLPSPGEKMEVKAKKWKKFPLKKAIIYSEILNRKYF